MDRRTMIVGCVAGAAGYASGAAAAGQAPQGSPQSLVTDAERGFAATMARRDFAAFPSFLSEEAIFLGNEGGTQILRGRRAIAEAWKTSLRRPAAAVLLGTGPGAGRRLGHPGDDQRARPESEGRGDQPVQFHLAPRPTDAGVSCSIGVSPVCPR